MGPGDLPIGRRRLLKAAVGSLLGVHIDYMVTIDLLGFKRLVDTLGGVDITVTRGVYDSFYFDENKVQTGFYIEPGQYHMDGHTALAYARSRFGMPATTTSPALPASKSCSRRWSAMSRPPTSSSTCPSS